jgi:cytoskeleton protein RodZ
MVHSMKNEDNSITEELKQDVDETGSDLKKVRESKGITLKDLFESTRIRISILEAIENEEFHLLPENFYTQTFIKTYAQAVGVESEKILSRYEKYLEQNKVFREGAVESKSCLSKFYASHRSLPRWIVTGLFIVVFVIFLLYPKQKAENVKKEVADKSKTAVIVKEVENQTSVVDKQAVEQKTEIEEESSVSKAIANKQNEVVEAAYKMTVEATERVWLNIKVDNNPPEEILLRPGEKIHKEASKEFTIDIGNAGGVNLTFQGESLGSLGEHGQVIHLTLPKDIGNGR